MINSPHGESASAERLRSITNITTHLIEIMPAKKASVADHWGSIDASLARLRTGRTDEFDNDAAIVLAELVELGSKLKA